jgi:hypothetical protein
MDVTDHELLTRELRRREAYLAEAQRLSHTGGFGWNISTGEKVDSHARKTAVARQSFK